MDFLQPQAATFAPTPPTTQRLHPAPAPVAPTPAPSGGAAPNPYR